jgi:agmatinase
MALPGFDPNAPASANNNIFGLPFSEEQSRVVLLPVPWEVTVSYGTGTARAPEGIFRASQQIDLYDQDVPTGWQKGFFMRPVEKAILMRSDYLRKEAELYIHFQLEEGNLEENEFMQNGLHEVNKGGEELNSWVYKQTRELLNKNKLVGLIGGDHSTPLGFYRALGEQYPGFGILHIDAHLDLRKGYEDFTYSHASIMYNALQEVPQIQKLVSVGARDYCQEELSMVSRQGERVRVFFDQYLKERRYEGETWSAICDEIIEQLPAQVHLSLDIDGLDPKLCPHTGTPVQGGMESGELFYLMKKVVDTGRQLIGFDVVEVGFDHDEYDANVGARVVFKLCNLMVRQEVIAEGSGKKTKAVDHHR